MKLLCKFYKPSSGAIKFDETLIEDYDVIEYRKIIGAVFQDYAKFDLTVRENTALSDLGKIAEDAARFIWRSMAKACDSPCVFRQF